MKYYLILSSGCYSDYDLTYYVGEKEVTQEELDKKAVEIGDKCLADYEALPERKHVCYSSWCCSILKKGDLEKYDPETNELVYDPFLGKAWPMLEKWVEDQGYTALPDSLPEVNIAYSDFPVTKD